MTETPTVSWDSKYEYSTVALMALGFALVGLDRFIIMPMFPVIIDDLGLSFQDLGLVTGALAFTWGIAALVMGNLSDRFGRRVVLTASLIAFSILVGFTGLAAGLVSLIFIRALMGLAEGAFTSPSIAATIDASHPDRRGRNMGFQQMVSPLVSIGLAPILVSQLLGVIDWRWVFILTALPGFILAFFVWKLMKPDKERSPTHEEPVKLRKLWKVLLLPNVPHLMVCMVCWLNCLIVISLLLPSYFAGTLSLSIQQSGFALSGMGFGSVCGAMAIPAISDFVGRKPAMVGGILLTLLAIWGLSASGDHVWTLFGWLFLAMFGTFGLITMTVGTVPAESVPHSARASAAGIVIAGGELFGGGVAPIFAGAAADRFSVAVAFPLVGGGLLVGLMACLMMKETAPRSRRKISSRHKA